MGIASFATPVGIGATHLGLGEIIAAVELMVALTIVAKALFGSSALSERAFRLLRWLGNHRKIIWQRTRSSSSLTLAAVPIFPSANGIDCSPYPGQPGLPGDILAALPLDGAETKYSAGPGRRRPVAEPDLDFWEFLPPQQARSSSDQAPRSPARRVRAWKSRAPTAPRWICMMVATSFCLKPQK